MADWLSPGAAGGSASSPLLPNTTFGVGGVTGGLGTGMVDHADILDSSGGIGDGCLLLEGIGLGDEPEVLGLEAAALPTLEASENQCLLSEDLYRLSSIRRIWKKESLELWALKDDAGYVLESRGGVFSQQFQRAQVRSWAELTGGFDSKRPAGCLKDRLVFAVRFFTDSEPGSAGAETQQPGGASAKWQRFRANSVHQMYRWMLVLRRLFPDPACPEPRPGLDFVSLGNEEFQGRWDKCHPSMLDAQLSHEAAHSNAESRGSDTGRPASRYQPGQQPPSYEAIMTQMKSCQVPAVFRQQEHTPPPLLPAGDPLRRRRRQEDDTFLPPHGPPVRWPLNLGQGEEFGLPEHVQHLWDFNLDRAVFVDHANKKVFYEDPRGADRAAVSDQLQQPCQQPTKYVIYREPEGRQSSTADILLSPENLSVLEAEKMAEAARSKPQLIVISSCGLNGADGLKGEDGRDGHPGEEGMPACVVELCLCAAACSAAGPIDCTQRTGDIRQLRISLCLSPPGISPRAAHIGLSAQICYHRPQHRAPLPNAPLYLTATASSRKTTERAER